MLNTFCEEMTMGDDLLNFHEKMLEKYKLPKWANVNCPFCNKDLPLRSIRSISLKLNTRNLGDLALEVFCPYCEKMDTLYFNENLCNISEFISVLNDKKEVKSTPFLEEIMYKKNYNNTLEKMFIDKELKNGGLKCQ